LVELASLLRMRVVAPSPPPHPQGILKVNPPYSRTRHTLYCKKCGTLFTPAEHVPPPPPPRLQRMTLKEAFCGRTPPPCPLRAAATQGAGKGATVAAFPGTLAAAAAEAAGEAAALAAGPQGLSHGPWYPPSDAKSSGDGGTAAASHGVHGAAGPAHYVLPVLSSRPPLVPPLRAVRGLSTLVRHKHLKLPPYYPPVDAAGRRLTHYCVDCAHYFHVPHVMRRVDPVTVYPSAASALDVRAFNAPAFNHPAVAAAVTQRAGLTQLDPVVPAGLQAFQVRRAGWWVPWRWAAGVGVGFCSFCWLVAPLGWTRGWGVCVRSGCVVMCMHTCTVCVAQCGVCGVGCAGWG
jgi:hypothetical protein